MNNVFRWTKLASRLVAAFVVILLISAIAAKKSYGDTVPYISLGKTYHNTELPLGGFGALVNDKYDINVSVIGGDIVHGTNEVVFGSVSRVFDPNWRVPVLGGKAKTSIGLAYTKGIPVCADASYYLRIIWEIQETFFLDIGHYSNAGINARENSGLDKISLTIFL